MDKAEGEKNEFEKQGELCHANKPKTNVEKERDTERDKYIERLACVFIYYCIMCIQF